MNKPLLHGLVFSLLLTGCQLPAVIVSTPQLEVEPVIGGKNAGIAAIVKPLPSPRLAVTPRPSLGRARSQPAQAGTAGAATGEGGAATDGQGAGQAPHLKVGAAAETGLKLVPIKDDAGHVTSLMAQPADGELTWRLEAANGSLAIAKVKVTYQSQATYPALSSTAPTGDAPPAVDPVSEAGEVMAFERPAAEFDLPDSLKAGTQGTLKFRLNSDDTFSFLEANPRSARALITLTPLDAAGQPLPGPDAQPLVIQSAITVL